MFTDLIHAPDWNKIWMVAKYTMPIHGLAFGIWLIFAIRKKKNNRTKGKLINNIDVNQDKVIAEKTKEIIDNRNAEKKPADRIEIEQGIQKKQIVATRINKEGKTEIYLKDIDVP